MRECSRYYSSLWRYRTNPLNQFIDGNGSAIGQAEEKAYRLMEVL
jgi:hypothetical protein